MSIRATFALGEQKDFYGVADFFRLIDCPFPVTVKFLRRGAQVSEAVLVGQGYNEQFSQPFDRVQILSSDVQEVHFVTRAGGVVGYDRPPTGDVAITNTGGAFTQGGTSVGSGAAVQLLAANPARRRVLVQNNTAAQYLRITLDGSAPTAANGLRLIPGDLLDLSDYCPTGAVRAIFESGAAADVEWAEG